MEIATKLADKSEKKSLGEYNREHLLSKYWGIKEVFHLLEFRSWRLFYWSFKKKLLWQYWNSFREKIHVKVWYQVFEITLPPHRSRLGNSLFILGDRSWYLFVVMMIFIYFVTDFFQWINLRSSLRVDVLFIFVKLPGKLTYWA